MKFRETSTLLGLISPICRTKWTFTTLSCKVDYFKVDYFIEFHYLLHSFIFTKFVQPFFNDVCPISQKLDHYRMYRNTGYPFDLMVLKCTIKTTVVLDLTNGD